MSDPTIMKLREALRRVDYPRAGVDIVAAGRLADLSVSDAGAARIILSLEAGDDAQGLIAAAKAAAERTPGVASANVVASAPRSPAEPSAKPAPSTARPAGGHRDPLGLRAESRGTEEAPLLPDVRAVVAIASGKGGVGKSTIAANLAVALARRGLKTGLLDADIYGPSAPTLFGLTGKAEMQNGKIAPFDACGVRVMSIGFLVDPEQALAWRGPMVMGALKQLMRDVDWGALDVLIVDTPPGTGDAHLSLIQTKRLTGAVIVSTPQEMALADMRRGVQLFRKTGAPILGVIENMAWLEGPGGERRYIFGEGGAKRAAASMDAPFLGAVPLIEDLRAASDAGAPAAAGDGPTAEIFAELARRLEEAIAP